MAKDRRRSVAGGRGLCGGRQNNEILPGRICPITGFPEAVQRKNHIGPVPLLLSIPDASVEVVGALVLAWPESLLIADADERLPLHIPCMWPGLETAAMIPLLVDRRGQALQQRDKDGKTPLHLAVQFRDDHAAVRSGGGLPAQYLSRIGGSERRGGKAAVALRTGAFPFLHRTGPAPR
jgi:hypothetical protein